MLARVLGVEKRGCSRAWHPASRVQQGRMHVLGCCLHVSEMGTGRLYMPA